MKFNAFFITLLGLIMVGISVGYVIGFYMQNNFLHEAWSYLAVLFMGVGCFMTIYGSLYLNK